MYVSTKKKGKIHLADYLWGQRILVVLMSGVSKRTFFVFVFFTGKKQDVWFVMDPETGAKQTSLTTSSSDSMCANTPLLYLGRTGGTHIDARADFFTTSSFPS